MKLCLNCYVIGEGYTLKCGDWPDRPELKEIRRRELPESEAAVFTGVSAPHLFLGTVEGRRFGCVRNLETDLKDENGRRCFIHMAVEGEGEEAAAVGALLTFALKNRRRFAGFCSRMITYSSGDYQLDQEGFKNLMTAAKRAADLKTDGMPSGILVPETTAEDFFANTAGFCRREDLKEILSFDEWKKQEAGMDLFLYCSTPSFGFVLSQIDTVTGEKLNTDKEANDRMVPYAQSVLTHSGAQMALFRQDETVCFVCRGIQSAEADQYGRRKKMSLVLQAPRKQSLPVRQLAAWALVDFETFSAQITDCVKIYDGPRGYEVQGPELCRLLEQVSEGITLPPGHPCRSLWKQVVSPARGCSFYCLVCDASLDYFCRSCSIDITDKDVGCLLTTEDFQLIQKKTEELVFTQELYDAPAREEEADPAGEEAVTVFQRPAPASSVSREEKPEPVKEERPKPEEKPVSVSGTARSVSSAEEEDRIDLLQQRWFLPAAAAVILLIAGGIALWLHFRA